MMMRMNNTVLSRFELETSNDEPQFEWHFRGQLNYFMRGRKIV